MKLLAIGLAMACAGGCSREAKQTRLTARAEAFFKSGELEKAKIEYLNLLRSDPQNVPAIQQLGLIWMEQGAPMRALPFLLKAREETPGNFEVRTKLASALMSLGQVAETRKEAIEILQLSPASGEALILLADTTRTPAEIAETERLLASFPQREDVSFHLASAKLALLKNDLPGATNALQMALSQDPKSTTAHLAMATYYLFQKKPEEAGAAMKTAAALSPIRSTARLKYAEFQARNGATAAAQADLEEMTRQAPDYLPAWCLRAQLTLNDKQPDAALALLENVISRDPEYFDARMLQSQIWLTTGEVKKAIESIERVETSYPNVPAVKFHLARAYLQDKNPTRASLALSKAVALYPDYEEAILLLAEVNLRTGNFPAVMTAMLDLLAKNPNLQPAQLLLAESYRSSGRLDDAAAVFREQIKTDPQRMQPHLLLGLVLRQQNKPEEAIAAFEKAHELAPDSSQPTAQLVELDIANKDFAKAALRLQPRNEKLPSAAGSFFLEARIHAAQQQWDLAEAALQKALDLDPELANAYDLLVAVYIAANQMPRALSQLDAVLARKPGNPRALMLQAMIYDQTNEFSKARDTYEKLLLAKPDSPLALNNLAYLYAERLNQLDKAYDLARQARELQPDDASVADTLGWILYKRGDYPQALSVLQESAAKPPVNPEIQFHLGMANYMMGQTDAARTAFQLAASSPADFSGKNEIPRKLALLGAAPGASAELSTTELEAILKQQPDDIFAQLRLGESYEKQEQHEKAAAAYETALRLNPKLLSVAIKLAQLNIGKLGNPGKALEYAKRARELSPSDPKIAGILGRAAYQNGDFGWSYSLLQESARLLPKDAGVLNDLAWAAYSLGKVKESQATMQRVVEANPDAKLAQTAQSFLAMTALDGNPQRLLAGETDVLKTLQTNPEDVPALMAQAALQSHRLKSKEAIATYLRVLQHFPDFALAQKRLAALYAETPDGLTKAYELAVKARKALPTDPEISQILGAISYQRKEYANVVQLLRDSVRSNPQDPKSLYYLGMSQRQLKNRPQSQDALRRALAAGLKEPLATEARQVVAEP